MLAHLDALLHYFVEAARDVVLIRAKEGVGVVLAGATELSRVGALALVHGFEERLEEVSNLVDAAFSAELLVKVH